MDLPLISFSFLPKRIQQSLLAEMIKPSGDRIKKIPGSALINIRTSEVSDSEFILHTDWSCLGVALKKQKWFKSNARNLY